MQPTRKRFRYAVPLALGLSLVSLPVEAQPFAYVTNRGTHDIAVLDIATRTVTGTVPLPDESTPNSVAFTPDGQFAYVTTSPDLSVINTATGAVADLVPVDLGPTAIAMTPDGLFAYVTNSGVHEVSIIDTTTRSVVSTVAVGITPSAVAITPNGASAYVVNSASDYVSVIDTATGTVVDTVTVGFDTRGVAIAPDGLAVYVGNIGSSEVKVISTATNTVTTTIPAGEAPTALAVHPDGTFVYAVDPASLDVVVISTATNMLTDVISLGSGSAYPAAEIAITSDGAFALVTNPESNTVSVVDLATHTLADTVAVGLDPLGIAILPEPAADGSVGPGGGAVADTAATGASFAVTSGVLAESVDVFIEVLPDPGVTQPPGFTAFGTFFVDFTLVPNPSPLSDPGATITLPTELPLADGTPLALFKYDPISELFVDTGIVGSVDIGGLTATFEEVVSFSVFVGLFNELTDSDGDGVLDDLDVCPDTFLPESVPTSPRGLGVNRWALVDADETFDTRAPRGAGSGLSFSLEDTAGCSCEQIVDALDLGNGHRMHGCSTGVMTEWTAGQP